MAIFFILQGCELDRRPLDKFAEDAFWTNEDNAILALTGIYRANVTFNGAEFAADWWSYGGAIFLEFASDNAYDRRGANSGFHRMTDGTLLSNNAHVKDYWKKSYAKIALCNQFLAGIDKLVGNPIVVERLKSEARFLRATQYFYLASFFHDVPLVTTVLTLEEANTVDINSRKEIIDYIIAEFLAAAQGLPRFKDLAANETGRASEQACLAFLGRTYLGEKRFGEAIKVYKEIIEYGDNIIDPDYASLFLPENENSAENIISMQYLQDLAGNGLPQHAYPAKDGGWCIINPTGSLFEAYQFTDGTDFSFESPLYDPAHLGRNRDPRLDATLLYDGSIFKGKEYISHPDSKSPDKVKGGQTTQTGFLMRKFFDESYTGSVSSYGGNIPIIRYAEVLLSYLEAKLENGETITQGLLDETINKIRGRASVNMPVIKETDPNKLRPILRNERRVELALEGQRLWDLMRWEIAHEVLNGDVYGAPFPGAVRQSPNLSGELDKYGRWYVISRAFRKDMDYKWPIPQSEQDINPNLR